MLLGLRSENHGGGLGKVQFGTVAGWEEERG